MSPSSPARPRRQRRAVAPAADDDSSSASRPVIAAPAATAVVAAAGANVPPVPSHSPTRSSRSSVAGAVPIDAPAQESAPPRKKKTVAKKKKRSPAELLTRCQPFSFSTRSRRTRRANGDDEANDDVRAPQRAPLLARPPGAPRSASTDGRSPGDGPGRRLFSVATVGPGAAAPAADPPTTPSSARGSVRTGEHAAAPWSARGSARVGDHAVAPPCARGSIRAGEQGATPSSARGSFRAAGDASSSTEPHELPQMTPSPLRGPVSTPVQMGGTLSATSVMSAMSDMGDMDIGLPVVAPLPSLSRKLCSSSSLASATTCASGSAPSCGASDVSLRLAGCSSAVSITSSTCSSGARRSGLRARESPGSSDNVEQQQSQGEDVSDGSRSASEAAYRHNGWFYDSASSNGGDVPQEDRHVQFAATGEIQVCHFSVEEELTPATTRGPRRIFGGGLDGGVSPVMAMAPGSMPVSASRQRRPSRDRLPNVHLPPAPAQGLAQSPDLMPCPAPRGRSSCRMQTSCRLQTLAGGADPRPIDSA